MIRVFRLYKEFGDCTELSNLVPEMKKRAAWLLSQCVFDILCRTAESVGIDPTVKYTSVGSLCEDLVKCNNHTVVHAAANIASKIDHIRLWNSSSVKLEDVSDVSLLVVSSQIELLWKELCGLRWEQSYSEYSAAVHQVFRESHDINSLSFATDMEILSYFKCCLAAYLAMCGISASRYNLSKQLNLIAAKVSDEWRTEINDLISYAYGDNPFITAMENGNIDKQTLIDFVYIIYKSI